MSNSNKYDLDKYEKTLFQIQSDRIDQLIKAGGLLRNIKSGADKLHLRDIKAYEQLRSELLTECPVMLSLFEQVAVIWAYTYTTKPCVLICGESGTGKESFARAFAAGGLRFVGINCTALPEYLLESELFGHVQGAFTGATKDRDGLFKIAGNGVIFLDEIGDMPLSLQPKLLRVLQERRYRPVGSNEENQVNCRVVCATHKSPDNFRADLFNRIAQYTIKIPPLRERPSDARLYLKSRYQDLEFVPEDVEKVIACGNYRELDNFAKLVQLKSWVSTTIQK